MKKDQAKTEEAQPKTVKMKFSQDVFYGREIAYSKDEVADVPYAEHTRWLTRGGELVDKHGKVEGLVERAVDAVKGVARTLVGDKKDKVSEEAPIDEATGLPAVPKSDTDGETVTDETLPHRPAGGPHQDGSALPKNDEDKGADGAEAKNAAAKADAAKAKK